MYFVYYYFAIFYGFLLILFSWNFITISYIFAFLYSYVPSNVCDIHFYHYDIWFFSFCYFCYLWSPMGWIVPYFCDCQSTLLYTLSLSGFDIAVGFASHSNYNPVSMKVTIVETIILNQSMLNAWRKTLVELLTLVNAIDKNA